MADLIKLVGLVVCRLELCSLNRFGLLVRLRLEFPLMIFSEIVLDPLSLRMLCHFLFDFTLIIFLIFVIILVYYLNERLLTILFMSQFCSFKEFHFLK